MACMDGDGVEGYEAAMLCSSVQVARPRVSTSGGQEVSVGTMSEVVEVEERPAIPAVPVAAVLNVRLEVLLSEVLSEEEDLDDAEVRFIAPIQAVPEVHRRQGWPEASRTMPDARRLYPLASSFTTGSVVVS